MSEAIQTTVNGGREVAPHSHPCPDCGKTIPCESRDCERAIARFLKRHPCAGAIFKPKRDAASGLYTCVHCGETELPADAMEPTREGEPSAMCRQCWFEFESARRDELPETMARWSQAAVDEAREGERRAALKKMSRPERRRAEVARNEDYLPGEIEWN